MKLKSLKNNGFTIIEVLLAAAIMLTVMTGASMALIATIKSDKTQKDSVLSGDIATAIMNNQVRSRPFSAPASTPSLCGDPDNSSSFAYKLKNRSSGLSSGTYFTVSDPSLTKLTFNPASSQAIVRIEPINVNTAVSPVYSTTKVKVTVFVKWKPNEQINVWRQAEVTSVVTESGTYDKDLAIIALPTTTPAP